MQHVEYFASSPLLSLVPLLLNQFFINVLFHIFKFIRVEEKAEAQAEGRKGIRAAMFDEYASEAENDISCLAGSFLLVQSIRYAQVGRLPNMVGELLDTPWSCVYMLYWTALVLVVLSVLLIVLKSRCEFEDGSFQARYMRVFSGMS